MRFSSVLALAVVLCASPASAKLLFTPPVATDNGIDVNCVVQNVSTKEVSIGVRLLDGNGNPVAAETLAVPAGGTAGSAGYGVPNFVYCEFDGLRGSVRGYALLRQGTATLLMLPATK